MSLGFHEHLLEILVGEKSPCILFLHSVTPSSIQPFFNLSKLVDETFDEVKLLFVVGRATP